MLYVEVLLSEHHYRSTTVFDVAIHSSAILESPLLYIFSFSLASSQTRRMLSFLVHLNNFGHALLKYWSAVKLTKHILKTIKINVNDFK